MLMLSEEELQSSPRPDLSSRTQIFSPFIKVIWLMTESWSPRIENAASVAGDDGLVGHLKKDRGLDEIKQHHDFISSNPKLKAHKTIVHPD